MNGPDGTRTKIAAIAECHSLPPKYVNRSPRSRTPSQPSRRPMLPCSETTGDATKRGCNHENIDHARDPEAQTPGASARAAAGGDRPDRLERLAGEHVIAVVEVHRRVAVRHGETHRVTEAPDVLARRIDDGAVLVAH